jgi:hypothetical protein
MYADEIVVSEAEPNGISGETSQVLGKVFEALREEGVTVVAAPTMLAASRLMLRGRFLLLERSGIL